MADYSNHSNSYSHNTISYASKLMQAKGGLRDGDGLDGLLACTEGLEQAWTVLRGGSEKEAREALEVFNQLEARRAALSAELDVRTEVLRRCAEGVLRTPTIDSGYGDGGSAMDQVLSEARAKLVESGETSIVAGLDHHPLTRSRTALDRLVASTWMEDAPRSADGDLVLVPTLALHYAGQRGARWSEAVSGLISLTDFETVAGLYEPGGNGAYTDLVSALAAAVRI